MGWGDGSTSRATPGIRMTSSVQQDSPLTELSKRNWEPETRANVKIGRIDRYLEEVFGPHYLWNREFKTIPSRS